MKYVEKVFHVVVLSSAVGFYSGLAFGANKNNEIIKQCVQQFAPDYNRVSACYFDWKSGD